MAEVSVILGSAGLFIAGFLAWYTMWHRRTATAFERIPVRTARSAGSARVVRPGGDGRGNPG